MCRVEKRLINDAYMYGEIASYRKKELWFYKFSEAKR